MEESIAWEHDLHRRVKYFAENAGGGAYWLLDFIALNIAPLQKRFQFIAMSLDVSSSSHATIKANDGNNNAIQNFDIEFTTCPEGSWEFWLVDNVLLLPSEY